MQFDADGWARWAAALDPGEWGPAASEAEVVAAERRLGVRLPPGFRAFLRGVGRLARPHFDVARTLSASELRWLRDAAPDRLAGWTTPVAPLLPFLALPRQGEDVDRRWNTAHLEGALLISPADAPTWLLLDPRDAPAGEWRAWVFSEWNGGADVRPDMGALLRTEFAVARQPAA